MSHTHAADMPRRVPLHKACPECHDVMMLSVMQPDGDGREMRTFECRGCGHSENLRLSFRA